MFGSNHYGIEPDIITIAKGVTSAYAPLSGHCVRQGLESAGTGTDENGLIGTAAGVANLKLIDELNLVQNTGEVETYLNKPMAEALADYANVGVVRGDGMLCAVEFVKDMDNRTFFDAAYKIGPQFSAKLLEQSKIIARAMPLGDILGFARPFALAAKRPIRWWQGLFRPLRPFSIKASKAFANGPVSPALLR